MATAADAEPKAMKPVEAEPPKLPHWMARRLRDSWDDPTSIAIFAFVMFCIVVAYYVSGAPPPGAGPAVPTPASKRQSSPLHWLTGQMGKNYMMNDARGEPQGLALPYCHHAGTSAAEAWLADTRKANRESIKVDEAMRKSYAPFRCYTEEDAQLHPALYTEAKVYEAMMTALPQIPADWENNWRPVVDRVFIEFHARFYIRVVAYLPAYARWAPVLLSARSLVQALTAWSDATARALGSHTLTLSECVCPQHLGILGSGLALRHTTSGWKLYVSTTTRPRSTQETRTRYEYSPVLHAFPLVGDTSMLTTKANRTFFYHNVTLFTGYALNDVGGREAIEALDKTIRSEWLVVEETELEEVPEGGDEEEERRVEQQTAPEPLSQMMAVHELARLPRKAAVEEERLAPAEAECLARCDRLDKRLRELAPPPPPAPPPPSPSTQAQEGESANPVPPVRKVGRKKDIL
jgi:hypothetical protein